MKKTTLIVLLCAVTVLTGIQLFLLLDGKLSNTLVWTIIAVVCSLFFTLTMLFAAPEDMTHQSKAIINEDVKMPVSKPRLASAVCFLIMCLANIGFIISEGHYLTSLPSAIVTLYVLAISYNTIDKHIKYKRTKKYRVQ